MMQQGFELALTGMSTVFPFLFLLIICMTIMSKVITFFEREADQALTSSEPEKKASLSQSHTIPDKLLIAVISTAIYQHRNKQKF